MQSWIKLYCLWIDEQSVDGGINELEHFQVNNLSKSKRPPCECWHHWFMFVRSRWNEQTLVGPERYVLLQTTPLFYDDTYLKITFKSTDQVLPCSFIELVRIWQNIYHHNIKTSSVSSSIDALSFSASAIEGCGRSKMLTKEHFFIGWIVRGAIGTRVLVHYMPRRTMCIIRAVHRFLTALNRVQVGLVFEPQNGYCEQDTHEQTNERSGVARLSSNTWTILTRINSMQKMQKNGKTLIRP